MIGIFIDLKNTFDTIDHAILLQNCIITAYVVLSQNALGTGNSMY